MKHEPTQSWRARGARLGVGGVDILLAIMTSVFGALNGNLLAKPRVRTTNLGALSILTSVGTAGFECNGPHAGPLFYRHLRAPKDRIGTHRKLWNGKHYGKHIQRL